MYFNLGSKFISEFEDVRAQFHQRSTYSFYACRSQKRKKDTYDLTVFLGSTSVKAVLRTLMKLTPECDIDVCVTMVKVVVDRQDLRHHDIIKVNDLRRTFF